MDNLSYTEAYTELQEIIEALQEEMIDIDHLAEKSRRAAFLINYCSEKLRKTEKEVNQLFEEDQG